MMGQRRRPATPEQVTCAKTRLRANFQRRFIEDTSSTVEIHDLHGEDGRESDKRRRKIE